MDNKFHSIQPISDDYSTDGHLVYTKAKEELFDNNFLNESLDAADEITQRTNSWTFIVFILVYIK